MALAIATLCGSLSLSASSSYSSHSALRDVDLALAAQQSSGTEISDTSSLVVVVAGKKKTKFGVEHHREGDSKPTLPPKFGLKWLENGDDLTGLKMEELACGGHGVLFGSRIPKHYFMVKGFGETDQGNGSDPWETGSYDLALEDAGIQDLNVVKYTSVIPPEAEPVSKEEAMPFLRHGAVQESIMAVMHGVKGDRITAGVGRMQIRRKKDKFHVGGYAAEYEGHATADAAKNILKTDLIEIFRRRFDENDYECFEEDFTIEEADVTKSFGSVLASICFVTYVTPAYTRS